MLRTDDLDYDLPEDLVAAAPVEPRDAARLLVVSRNDPTQRQHLRVADLPDLLAPKDVLIRNVTRVIPARIHGIRTDTGGRMEGLFIDVDATHPNHWHALIKMRRMRPGVRIELVDQADDPSGVELELVERTNAQEADWLVRVHDDTPTPELLERLGRTPLPPYIRSARKRGDLDLDDAVDRVRYQTTFAAADQAHSIAAPTAGLHFTPSLDARLAGAGVSFADVVLHVGLGTFKPIETDVVEEHPMHAEWCAVPAGTARAVTSAKEEGGSVIAVGTTSARTLESFEALDEPDARTGKNTRLLVTPGHEWRHVDALMTNFHLPRSTLLAMVGALFPNGVGDLLDIYQEAIAHRYRFYSYGDAMLII